MITKADEEETKQILHYAAQSLFEGTRGNCQLSTEKAIEITKPLVEKGAYYIVTKEENKVVGWILIGENVDYFSREKLGFIYELYVFSEYRGRGLSRKLMKIWDQGTTRKVFRNSLECIYRELCKRNVRRFWLR